MVHAEAAAADHSKTAVNDFVQSVVSLVQEQQHWDLLILFALAFGESFAFVSLFVPATLAAADFEFWPIWGATSMGAVVGDWLAYELAFGSKNASPDCHPFAAIPRSCVAAWISSDAGDCFH